MREVVLVARASTVLQREQLNRAADTQVTFNEVMLSILERERYETGLLRDKEERTHTAH